MYQPGEFDIAIIGLAGKFPGADSVDAYWRNLVEGRECIRFFSDEELDRAGVPREIYQRPGYVKAAPVIEGPGLFDARFFGYSQRDAELMDPQHRVFLQCCYHALENAGHTADGFDGRVGVYAGSAMNTYFLYANLAERFAEDYLPTLLASDKDFLSTRVSYQLNLTGPSLTIQTACSTSLVAVHTACQSLINEECDMAMAGGVSIRVPHIAGHQAEEGSVFSPDGHCRPFDASAAGTIFGSGAGVVVLKRAIDAVADGDTIMAVIKGSAVNNDGNRKSGYTAPGVEMQSRAAIEAYAAAGIEPAMISYIEAHGTGTYLGDPIEVAALTSAFRTQTQQQQFCRIGSVKSNIGHLDAAAGVAGLIKTALALKHRTLPPTLHYTTPNPQIDFATSPFIVNHQLTPWATSSAADDIRYAAVNSLGIGGTNAHLVLEEGPRVEAASPGAERPQLLVLSARTETALDATAAKVVSHLVEDGTTSLADAAFTLQTGRNRMEHRRSVVVTDRDDVELLAGQPRAANRLDNPDVIFMFPGQGAQYAGMARGLYEQDAEFKRQIDTFHDQLLAENNIDLRGVLFPAAGEEQQAAELLRRTHVTQPALFAIEYALARLLMRWGVQPAGVTGHSVGEYAAACIAGVMQPADALRLVALRGAMISELPEGKMLAVALPGEAVQERLDARLELAAMNSPGASVVAGDAAMVDAFEAELSNAGVPCQVLRTSHAFHSGMMAPVLEDFRAAVEKVQLRPAQLPIYSTVTGATADPAAYAQPQFWVDNIRQPVRFSEAAAELLKQPNRVLLETGPGQTLSGFIREQPGHNQHHVICTSLRHPREDADDYAFLLRTLGKLWEAGVTPDWQNIHGANRQRVPLPGYVFDNENYWLARSTTVGSTSTTTTPAEPSEPAARPQIPRRPVPQWLYKPKWQAAETGASDEPSTLINRSTDSTWLVFGGREWLPQETANVVTVKPGEMFQQISRHEYRINIHAAEDYRKLLSSLEESDILPSHVLHTWMTGEDVEDAQELQRGLNSLTFFTAATGNVCPLHQLQLFTITHKAIPATQDDIVLPARAAAIACCKLIPQEHPGVACRHIDLPDDINASHRSYALQKMLAQAAALDGGSYAYRDGKLLTECFEPCEAPSAGVTKRLRDGDTYLLFGGLGGIGLTLAREIARQVRANLVLVSRGPLPLRDEASPRDLKKLKIIDQIRAAGCQVLTVQGDVSRSDSIAQVLQQTADHFGAVHGVIHAAGVSGPLRPLQQSSQEDIAACMPAKLHGVALLEELLADQPLRFILGCSTIGATLHHHRIGELSYLAANMALDAFPFHQRTRGDGVFRQTIQWDEWSEAGMAADLAASGGNPSSPLFDIEDTISPEEGAKAFAAALATDEPRVIVSVHDLIKRLATADASESHTEASQQAAISASAASDTIASLTQIWSELLGARDIRPGDDFFELGGSSLLAVRMNSQIADRLGKKLPVGSILELRTITRLAELIDGGQKKSHPSLVAIQPKGARPPLFLMHAAGGNVMFYRQLAAHLPSDQPVYGLQSQALIDGEATFRSIEEMASGYAAAMLAMQPDGPYLTGGYCMGGTLALEVAQQLRQRGKEVAVVAMFETYNWEKCKRRKPMSGGRFWLEKVYFALRNVFAAGSGASKFVREKLSVVGARRKVWRGELQRKVHSAQASDQQMLAQLWENNDRAAMQYRPQPYDLPVTIFRPEVRHAVFRDCEFDQVNCHIETLPCFPAAMMLEPFVAELARRLNQRIEQAIPTA